MLLSYRIVVYCTPNVTSFETVSRLRGYPSVARYPLSKSSLLTTSLITPRKTRFWPWPSCQAQLFSLGLRSRLFVQGLLLARRAAQNRRRGHRWWPHRDRGPPRYLRWEKAPFLAARRQGRERGRRTQSLWEVDSEARD